MADGLAYGEPSSLHLDSSLHFLGPPLCGRGPFYLCGEDGRPTYHGKTGHLNERTIRWPMYAAEQICGQARSVWDTGRTLPAGRLHNYQISHVFLAMIGGL